MALVAGMIHLLKIEVMKILLPFCQRLLGTCQKFAGGRGGEWKQGEGHNVLRLRKGRGHEKWAVKSGRVMQIYARDHIEVHKYKKKEVLYLVKKKKKTWEK